MVGSRFGDWRSGPTAVTVAIQAAANGWGSSTSTAIGGLVGSGVAQDVAGGDPTVTSTDSTETSPGSIDEASAESQ